jgi:hypothetical protein
MDIKPNIKNNFGPFTPRGFNKLAAKANESKLFETSKNFDKLPPLFIAQITGSVDLIANRRWKYTWNSGNLDSSGLFQSRTESITYGKTGVYAYNTCEALQQASGTYNGPGITHIYIPTGYLLKPIESGTFVHMFMSRGSDSKISFTFTLANAIDGTCA